MLDWMGDDDVGGGGGVRFLRLLSQVCFEKNTTTMLSSESTLESILSKLIFVSFSLSNFRGLLTLRGDPNANVGLGFASLC